MSAQQCARRNWPPLDESLVRLDAGKIREPRRYHSGWMNALDWRADPALTPRPPAIQLPRPLNGRVLALPVHPQRSFEAFVQEHERALHTTALRLCGDAQDARDLVQDTLERGLRSFDRYRPGTNGRGWLLTILNNLLIDRCRSRSRDPRSPVEAEDVAATAPVPGPTPEPGWATLTTEQVQAAISRLGEEFRTVYHLHAIEQRSYAEIALRLGISKATVGTRLLRARRRLKELLSPEVKEPAP